jgi:hypothetical protein
MPVSCRETADGSWRTSPTRWSKIHAQPPETGRPDEIRTYETSPCSCADVVPGQNARWAVLICHTSACRCRKRRQTHRALTNQYWQDLLERWLARRGRHSPPSSQDRRGIHSGARHNWARTVDANLTRNLSKRNETAESRVSGGAPLCPGLGAPPESPLHQIADDRSPNAVAQLDGHALLSGASGRWARRGRGGGRGPSAWLASPTFSNRPGLPLQPELGSTCLPLSCTWSATPSQPSAGPSGPTTRNGR